MGLVCGAYMRSNLHERCYPLACIWSQHTVTNCNSLIVVCPVHFIALFDSILLLTSLSKTSSKEYMQMRAVAIVDGGTAYCSVVLVYGSPNTTFCFQFSCCTYARLGHHFTPHTKNLFGQVSRFSSEDHRCIPSLFGVAT